MKIKKQRMGRIKTEELKRPLMTLGKLVVRQDHPSYPAKNAGTNCSFLRAA
jgi:hypothetical protein